MTIPPQRTANRMRRAAELRVAGHSWNQIGDRIGVTGQGVIDWRRRYPSYWEHLLAEVRAEQLTDAGDEALGVLRRLLRSDSEATRKDAAKQLRAECDSADPPEPPAPKSEFHHIADHLASLTHDQRQQLLDRELARRAGPAPDAPGRPDGGAGA